MATVTTRVYLPSTGAPVSSPGFIGGWEDTAAMDRRLAVLTRISSAMATKSTAGIDSASATFDTGLRQYVLEGLAADIVFTNTDVILGQLRCQQVDSAQGYVLDCAVRVLGSDATTVRATLRAMRVQSTDFASAALTNRSLITTANASYTTVANDMLVIEWGFRQTATHKTGLSSINFGDNGVTDLLEDEVVTTALNPWIEFQLTGGVAITLVTATGIVNRAGPVHASGLGTKMGQRGLLG